MLQAVCNRDTVQFTESLFILTIELKRILYVCVLGLATGQQKSLTWPIYKVHEPAKLASLETQQN